MRTTLATLLFALLIATPAQANIAGTKSGTKALAAAKTYWGQTPQGCSKIQILYRNGPIEEFGWAYLAETGRNADCRIWLNRRVFKWLHPMDKPWVICNIVVHEYGHLLGHDHINAGDSSNVMLRDPLEKRLKVCR